VIVARITDHNTRRFDPIGSSWCEWLPRTDSPAWDTYLASLAARQRLNASSISSLENQAATIEAQAKRIVPVAPPSGGGGGVTGSTMTVSATGYSLRGRTATGIPVGWGVVAVDPSVIPLGTRMTIPGYGEGIAADTGSAVVGATIDLWFPTLAQARAWGRQTVTIALH